MVFESNSIDVSGEGKIVAYDLRQIYAELLGEHLKDAAEARKANNYYVWFKALEDIKTISQHKFKDKKKALTEYDNIKVKIKKLANSYPTVWKGTNQNAEQIEKIEDALRELEEFIYNQLEAGKLFGDQYKIPGL